MPECIYQYMTKSCMVPIEAADLTDLVKICFQPNIHNFKNLTEVDTCDYQGPCNKLL